MLHQSPRPPDGRCRNMRSSWGLCLSVEPRPQIELEYGE